jgi:hypothetical protein
VDSYARYAHDSEVLGRIGKVLFPQDTELPVRLPADLAGLAVAAWQRDESGLPEQETPEQRQVRHQAATLALIGLCVEYTGRPDGDEILCDLDAWYIGGALDAADQQELAKNFDLMSS